jgi:23S rRNA G2445 N2-methylase RlmL
MWQIVQPDVTQEARRYAKSMSEADEEILDQALEQWEAAGKDEPIGFYLASVREKSYAE